MCGLSALMDASWQGTLAQLRGLMVCRGLQGCLWMTLRMWALLGYLKDEQMLRSICLNWPKAHSRMLKPYQKHDMKAFSCSATPGRIVSPVREWGSHMCKPTFAATRDVSGFACTSYRH